MRKILSKINHVLSIICGVLMVAMMILLCIDILFRIVPFLSPLEGIPELSVFVMVLVIYLGLALCEEHQEHVRLELLLNRLPLKMAKVINLISIILEFICVTIMLYAVAKNAGYAFFSKEGVVAGTYQWSVWPVKFVMVIGIFFYLLQVILKCTDFIRTGEIIHVKPIS